METNYDICVVTAVPPDGDPGNLALAMPLYIHRHLDRAAEPFLGAPALYMRAPVFRVGEILILNADGREFAGKCRKPDKWAVQVQSFGTDMAAALQKSIEVCQ